MMAAAVHRLRPDSVSAGRKAEILREARGHIAAKNDLAAHVVQHRPEDPVRKWAREHSAQERAANRIVHSVREHAAVEQRADSGGGDWATWVRNEIRAAVKAEHEFMVEVIGGVIAEERRRAEEESERKIKALELQLGELRGLLRERVGEIAEKSGKNYLELGQRLTEIEKSAVGMKTQIEVAEKMSTEAATFFRKMFTGS
jgi:hypothetical protein